jgi:hypothetical protein
MIRDSRTVAAIKGQMSKFSGIIAKGLPKPKQKLIREMIYGMQAAKDIKLSCITRALNEPIRLIKTEDRLSRNLDDRDFTEEINNQIWSLPLTPEIYGKNMLRRWNTSAKFTMEATMRQAKDTGCAKRSQPILNIRRLSPYLEAYS